MNKIILNLTNAASREEIHDILTISLALPDYYGRNLDALYDCLSELYVGKTTLIEIYGYTTLPTELSDYANRLITVLRQVSNDLSSSGTNNPSMFIVKVVD